MKQILFVTDSLGLPRLKPEPVLASQAWPYLLAAELSREGNEKFLFCYHCLHGLTTDGVVDHITDVLGAYNPAMVIIQVGIVDCYPRSLKKSETAVLRRVPGVNKVTHWFVKRYYKKIVALRNITYVDISKFEDNCRRIRDSFKNSEIVVIPIAPPNEAFSAKNPRITDNVSAYNAVLERIYGQAYLADLFEGGPPKSDLFISDNYHLSSIGNKCIVDKLLARYLNWFRNA